MNFVSGIFQLILCFAIFFLNDQIDVWKKDFTWRGLYEQSQKSFYGITKKDCFTKNNNLKNIERPPIVLPQIVLKKVQDSLRQPKNSDDGEQCTNNDNDNNKNNIDQSKSKNNHYKVNIIETQPMNFIEKSNSCNREVVLYNRKGVLSLKDIYDKQKLNLDDNCLDLADQLCTVIFKPAMNLWKGQSLLSLTLSSNFTENDYVFVYEKDIDPLLTLREQNFQKQNKVTVRSISGDLSLVFTPKTIVNNDVEFQVKYIVTPLRTFDVYLVMSMVAITSIFFIGVFCWLSKYSSPASNNSVENINNLLTKQEIQNLKQAKIETLYSISTSTSCGLNENENENEKMKNEKSDELDIENACSVCLLNLQKGDDIFIIPCKHYFHANCLKEWLEHNSSCPLCRKDVRLNPPSKENEDRQSFYQGSFMDMYTGTRVDY